MWHLYPAASDWNTAALIPLAVLALSAELMGYLLPRGAVRGSIWFCALSDARTSGA